MPARHKSWDPTKDNEGDDKDKEAAEGGGDEIKTYYLATQIKI